jgi:hypothetical protein
MHPLRSDKGTYKSTHITPFLQTTMTLRAIARVGEWKCQATILSRFPRRRTGTNFEHLQRLRRLARRGTSPAIGSPIPRAHFRTSHLRIVPSNGDPAAKAATHSRDVTSIDLPSLWLITRRDAVRVRNYIYRRGIRLIY